MYFAKSIEELIGNTPLLRLDKIKAVRGYKTDIYAKLEFFNPGGSVKDRVAFYMLQKAVKEKRVNRETLIIEPTSGNTGIGLASVCAALGLKLMLVMPDTMSMERRAIMRAYGAELLLTDGKKGMKYAIEKARELASANENSFIPAQFENPANPEIHELTTGPEIYNALEGDIGAFISAVGTGGTITGTGRYLKTRIPDIKIIAAEPAGSPVLSGGDAGPHGIQGIGAGFVPEVLDTNLIDEIITVTDEEAIENMKFIAKTEGILAGISSGAAFHAADLLAERNEYKNIVVVFPDTGTRYLSQQGIFI